MTTAGVVRLVAEREIWERLRAKSFKVSTVVIAIGLLAAVVVPQLLGGDDERPTYQVGVVSSMTAAVTEAVDGLRPAVDAEVNVVAVADLAAGEQQLGAGDLDAVVGRGEVVVEEEPDAGSPLDQLTSGLGRSVGAIGALENAGLAPEAAASVLRQPPLPVRSLSAGGDDSQRPLVFLGVLVLYLLLLTYGGSVAVGVVEEKASRVVEVILSAVRPYQLLAGKVLGIGVLGLIQLVVVAAPALIVAVATGAKLPSGSPLTVASLLLWFVVGYALYSCAYAALGSTVSRSEEAQNASFPMSGLLIAAYFAALAALDNPDGVVVRVLALVPFTAPLVMPARAALGHAAPWEVPLAVVLTLAMTYALVRLGGRIYSGAVLRFGAKVHLRQALRSGAQRDEPAAA
ncbi:MAG: ABC transporter permease [Acidimicrobiales bacterium]